MYSAALLQRGRRNGAGRVTGRKERKMAYRCDQAVFGGAREPIRCKVSGSVCAHQKMCMMEGRIVLTDKAMTCPARDGQLPEDRKDETETKKPAAAETTAKKAVSKTETTVKKTASKTGTTAKKTTTSKKKV